MWYDLIGALNYYLWIGIPLWDAFRQPVRDLGYMTYVRYGATQIYP